MALNCENGSLEFDDGRGRLAPGLTRREFLSSEVAAEAAPWIENEPYCSWRLVGVQASSKTFAVIVWFEAEWLTGLSLVGTDPAYGQSWPDWSHAREAMRKKSHDDWLTAEIGTRRSFSWGSVASIIDPKTGDATVRVTYERHGNGRDATY